MAVLEEEPQRWGEPVGRKESEAFSGTLVLPPHHLNPPGFPKKAKPEFPKANTMKMHRNQIFDALRGLGGKGHVFEICEYIAKEQGRKELSSKEKHYIRSALFQLKGSKKVVHNGDGVYSLLP
jgi:hypothetical protein